MRRCPLQGEPVTPRLPGESPGRGMAVRGHPRTEVTLQLGQHPGHDLLSTSRQKASLPAPPELLQPSQGNAFAFWSILLLTVQIWVPLALPVVGRVFKVFQIHPVEFGWCLSEFQTANLGFYLKIEQTHRSLG